MTLHRRHFLQYATALAGTVGLSSTLLAQSDYPVRPIRMVVPFTAGSTTDVIGRTVAEQLEKKLGQPVVVENRPGAGGVLGATMVAGAAADGYTVLVHSAAHVANQSLYANLKYDTLKDFAPVTMLASMPNVIVASNARNFTSLKDLVERARAEPDQYTYGSSGSGSGAHIAGEKFRAATGIQAIHVPYRGTPEAVNDVIAGRVDWFFLPLPLALPMVKAGKLTALAISADSRSPALPDVPTTAEAGYRGVDQQFWVAMFAPAATPPAVLAKLHAGTEQALRSETTRERFENLGAEPAPMPQQQFAELISREMESTGSLIRGAGIRVGN
ncbi:tripartite tricarboxylate transporter substrate binding protein [Achromobacter sp. SD115]|uniref:Bug family tripartite tricarboxylate transporter substrate binding protein n=1 Tax=Achromobacter sp. SD115 TaxID=2782011 RepID=UPI001A97C8E4|nr:tripartite tricarboxylate transporter substrate binding protein [Achromobacter sp. SD115]MBO1012431.1 tripartite tricarboxylate transporter substrate binding protein [Achromobacter sp. SD115]